MTKRENKSPSRSAKRALTSSVLALVLCFVMLLGTTFAWFTDTASTKVNKIQAGNLDVALEMWDKTAGTDKTGAWVSAEGKTLDFKWSEPEQENKTILWEPGCKFTLPAVRVVNNGNLALKYKVVITAVNGSKKLAEVLDVSIATKNAAGTEGTKDGFKLSSVLNADYDTYMVGNLTAGQSEEMTITVSMPTTAGNEYQGLSIEGISITVLATQAASEYDSTTNQYDKDATYFAYPEGVTAESFNTNKAIAVDSNGKFYSTFKDALAAGGTLYLKENSTVPEYNAHPDVTKDITIYANGATFNNDISIGKYAKPESSTVNVTIYDAKNLTVWGEPQSNGTTWNVTMIGCENDGHGLVMYRGDEGKTDKINLVMRNCTASGYTDSIIHTTADGTMLIEDCVFTDNCAPINIAHKQSGDMTVTVKNCSFIRCGKINSENDYFAPARFVNTGTGKLTVNLENNTYTDTIGTNGDVEIGDFRDGKTNKAVTLTSKGTYLLKCSTAAAAEVTDASGTYHSN